MLQGHEAVSRGSDSFLLLRGIIVSAEKSCFKGKILSGSMGVWAPGYCLHKVACERKRISGCRLAGNTSAFAG